MNIKLSVAVLIGLCMVAIAGCRLVQRSDQTGNAGKPKGSIASGEYDLVWVDPQMIFSDSLCSLIRASRIDSLPKDPRLPKSTTLPSVEFQVERDQSLVSATLNDSHGKVVQSLLFRQLNRGMYRLSPERTTLGKLQGSPGLLVVNVVGKIIRREIE